MHAEGPFAANKEKTILEEVEEQEEEDGDREQEEEEEH